MPKVSSLQSLSPAPLSRTHSLQSASSFAEPLFPEALDEFVLSFPSTSPATEVATHANSLDWTMGLARIVEQKAASTEEEHEPDGWDQLSLSGSVPDPDDWEDTYPGALHEEPVNPGHSRNSSSSTSSSSSPSTTSAPTSGKTKQKRSYSKAFKHEILEYVAANPNQTIPTMAKLWGIPPRTMDGWIPSRKLSKLSASSTTNPFNPLLNSATTQPSRTAEPG